jgi:hypothetical protein
VCVGVVRLNRGPYVENAGSRSAIRTALAPTRANKSQTSWAASARDRASTRLTDSGAVSVLPSTSSIAIAERTDATPVPPNCAGRLGERLE